MKFERKAKGALTWESAPPILEGQREHDIALATMVEFFDRYFPEIRKGAIYRGVYASYRMGSEKAK